MLKPSIQITILFITFQFSKSISNPHSKDGAKTTKNIVKVTETEEGEKYSNDSINRTKESEADDAALQSSLTYGKVTKVNILNICAMIFYFCHVLKCDSLAVRD